MDDADDVEESYSVLHHLLERRSGPLVQNAMLSAFQERDELWRLRFVDYGGCSEDSNKDDVRNAFKNPDTPEPPCSSSPERRRSSSSCQTESGGVDAVSRAAPPPTTTPPVGFEPRVDELTARAHFRPGSSSFF